MRNIRHWSPKYIKNRLALMYYERTHPGNPWLTRDMIEILDGWLKPSDIGLEFGSGRSTKWFADRVGHLSSVEHDANWFKIVQAQIADLDTVDYVLHADGLAETADSNYVNVA